MTNSPVFIREETVLIIHQKQLAEHGGLEGIRNKSLLESALLRAKNHFYYENEKSLEKLAALYTFGIIRDHPFNDGNKRVALVICLLFLELNGVKITATEIECYKCIMAIANGTLTEEEFTQWLGKNSSQNIR